MAVVVSLSVFIGGGGKGCHLRPCTDSVEWNVVRQCTVMNVVLLAMFWSTTHKDFENKNGVHIIICMH